MGRLKSNLFDSNEVCRKHLSVGDIAETGRLVIVWCNRCGHNETVPPLPLVLEYGPECPVAEIGSLAGCRSCRCRDVASAVSACHCPQHDHFSSRGK